MSTGTEVLFQQRGKVGLITLNRPAARNALTREMCLMIHRRLLKWARDPEIVSVCIQGSGDRVFCAGGDIRALYASGRDDTPYCKQFFADQYQLIRYIKRYPKPYIALMDGVAMSSGIGLSVHGAYCITGDDTEFAMPETGIGFVPDCGASYFLSRLPARIGFYLGLTGASLSGRELVFCKGAAFYVPSGRHHSVIEDLETADASDIRDVLIGHSRKPGNVPIADHVKQINRIFSLASVEEILAALREDTTPWGQATLKALSGKSPTSLMITFRQLSEARAMEIEDCLKMEYRLVRRIFEGHDFYEGVRAAILDKDKKPNWKPYRIKDLTLALINRHFDGLGDREIAF